MKLPSSFISSERERERELSEGDLTAAEAMKVVESALDEPFMKLIKSRRGEVDGSCCMFVSLSPSFFVGGEGCGGEEEEEEEEEEEKREEERHERCGLKRAWR